MRKLLPILLLFAGETALAQANAINIICSDCRDPHEYPDDYVNFAVNQVYGPNAWLSFDQADDFYLVNPDGFRVYVDIDFVFHPFGLAGFRFPIWPANFLKITLALPNGNLYTAVRSVFQTPLPVPTTTSPPARDTGQDRDDDDDGADDPEGDDDDYGDSWEDSETENTGWTSIQDPDENGDFPDDEWCVEC